MHILLLHNSLFSRIEETLGEIDGYLKNGNKKELTRHRKSSLHSLENTSEKHNAVRECLQKMVGTLTS